MMLKLIQHDKKHMRQTTLCYLVKDGKVLLAMKKRGFATGKMNGPGGKVEAGETPEDACRREFFEETNSRIGSVEERGVIEFVFADKPDWNQECHIYVATEYEDEPVETEEMRPDWHDIGNLPLSDMWEDDPIWLPGVLVGGTVNMRFNFDANSKMLSYEAI